AAYQRGDVAGFVVRFSSWSSRSGRGSRSSWGFCLSWSRSSGWCLFLYRSWGSSWCCFLGWRSSWSSVSRTDYSKNGANFSGLVFWNADFQQGTSNWGRNFGVNLVGGNLKQWLVDGNFFANFLQPTGDGTFGNRLAQSWKGNFGARCSAS